MRYDEIDLNLDGKLTIQGVQGGNKNLIQYKDGIVSWVTASTPTAIDSLIKNIGGNFRIVESVSGDSSASGINFQNAYNAFLTEVATLNLSETNRYTFLLTPGFFQITTMTIGESYIDIVGLSSNQKSTSISGIITLSGTSIKLKNLFIVDFNVFDTGSNFVYGENLIVNYQPFASTDLRGEFRNIRVLSGGSFGNATNSIEAIFENIYFEGTSYASFNAGSNGMIQGTFSNITFEDLGGNTLFHVSHSDFDCKINLYDFKILNGDYQFAVLNGTVSGTFENLDIKTNNNIFFLAKGLEGVWKNVKIENPNSNYVFNAFSFNADMENMNFEIGNPNQFFTAFFRPLYGTFSNVSIKFEGNLDLFNSDDVRVNINNFYLSGGTVSSIFKNSGVFGTVSGNFKNIEIESILSGFSVVQRGNLTGNFENIKINTLSVDCFTTQNGKILGNFKNIEINNCVEGAQCFVSSSFLPSGGGIDAIFENISNTNLPGQMGSFFFSNDFIYGTFKNLQLTAYSILVASKTISCIVDNLQFNSNELINSTDSNVICTASNITYMSGPNTITKSFTSNTYNVEGTYDRIYLEGELFGKVFSAGNFLRGRFSNIRLGYCNPSMVDDVFKGYDINGEFSDIICGSGSGYNIFSSSDNLRGTFSNIRIGNNWNYIFTTTNEISGKFKDLYIPNTVSNYSFQATSMSYSTIFDNVKNYNLFGVPFNGVMSNCVMSDPNIQINEGNYEPFEVDFTYPVLIENTDFNYYGSIEIPIGFSSYFVFGDIFNIYAFNVENVHILNCGLRIGFPLSYKPGYPSQDPSNQGITPILGTGSINVIGIPQPK